MIRRYIIFFFFSSRRRHTRLTCDWSSDVCSSDLVGPLPADYDPKEDKIERGTANGKYGQWTKEVGEKLHIPVLDLTNLCADKYEAMGREEVNKLYTDHNHTYVPGAEIVAESIVSGLKAFKDSPFI